MNTLLFTRNDTPRWHVESVPHFALLNPVLDFQSEMNRLVAGFVSEITDLARKAARDMIDQALGGSRATGDRHRSGRSGKRSSDDIDQLADTVVAFVAKHPGLRIEQINKQLGTTTKQLALPIRKLVAEGGLKTKGKRRSTVYFVGERKKKS